MKNTKGLAITQGFTAHCAIKNEQMVNIWKFDLISKYDSHIELNFQTFAICLVFMDQWAVKFLIIPNLLKIQHPLK